MSFDVSTLIAYRDEHATELKGKLKWAGDSTKLFQKIPGVTRVAAINYMDINPILQKSTFCTAMNTSGSTPISQKDISVCDFKVEDSWCENTLQQYYFTDQLKGVSGDTLGPWEARFLDQVTVNVLQKTETAVWQNTNPTSSCVGLIDQIKLDSGRISTGSATVTVSNVISNVTSMLSSLEASAPNISQDNELYIFVSPKVHTLFMQATYAANNFGKPLITYDANGDIVIDYLGPKVTLHKTYGLLGTDHMVLTTLKNLYHAFDGVSDEEKVALWYEQKDDILYYRSKFRLGVTFWLGEYIVCNF